MNNKSNQKKTLFIVAGTFIAASLLVIGLFIVSLIIGPKGQITLRGIPEKVTLTSSDGLVLEISDREPVSLSVGKYSFVISAEGFESITREVIIEKGETTTLAFRLTPITQDATKESEDPKYDSVKEAITGDAMTRGGAEIEAANPILKHLPLYDVYIRIVACSAYRDETISKGKIGLCITVIDEKNDFYVKEALELLRETGEDYDEYDIKINGVIYPNKAERASGAKFVSER